MQKVRLDIYQTYRAWRQSNKVLFRTEWFIILNNDIEKSRITNLTFCMFTVGLDPFGIVCGADIFIYHSF